MSSAPRKSRAFSPDPEAPGRPCDAPGCACLGEYKAPKGRDGGRDFHWFCLEHVREYNAAWDFYKGMSPEQIEAEVRADTFWQRPTWPLGSLGQSAKLDEALREKLSRFRAAPQSTTRAPSEAAPPELREALGVLDLIWPVTLEAVKAKYKVLAKRHHPDANDGDKRSEEMLKTINLAYATLRGKLMRERANAPRSAAE